MKKNFYIFTKLRLGLDSGVWITILLVLMVSLFILGFKIATHTDCSLNEISATGLRQQTNNVFFIGETVTFSLPNQTGNTIKWNFNDGTPEKEGEKIIQHKFLIEGAFNVDCITTDKCEQNVQINVISVPSKTNDTFMVYTGPSITGDSIVNIGVVAQYFTSVKTNSYAWSASGSPGIQTNQNASFIFYKEGPQIVTLKIDGNKTFTKTILVQVKNDVSGPVPAHSFKFPPAISSISPVSGGPGTIVIITGSMFNNTTSVSFGGIEAKSFKVISSNQITAVVNEGSQSGFVSVVTVNGSAPSPLPQFNFIVPKTETTITPSPKTPISDKPRTIISKDNLISALNKVKGCSDDMLQQYYKQFDQYFCQGVSTNVQVNKHKDFISLSELCKRLQADEKIVIESGEIIRDLSSDRQCEIKIMITYYHPSNFTSLKFRKRYD